MSTLETDTQLTGADKHVLAESMLSGKAVSRPNPLAVADLANAITGLNVSLIRNGAPSLVIALADPSWALLDSGFFDADSNGLLDLILVNYPQSSRYWWVLNQVTPAFGARTITLTFIPRIAYALMRTWAARKTNRAGMTRAEFLRGLVVDAAKNHGFAAEFYCQQLDAKQKIAAVSQTSTSTSSQQASGQAHKTTGLSNAQGTLTCRGKPLTTAQKQVANVALGACATRHAPQIVAVAMIYAAMGESSLGAASGDVWQNSTSDSVETEAHFWLAGGHGFQQGGGIACAKANPTYVAWQIANAVEANAVWNSSRRDSYAAQQNPPTVNEAQAIVQGGGFNGTSSGSFEVVQPYFFTVGTSASPNASYFDALQRLSSEVGWSFILDGDRVYYDSEPTLIKAKVASVVTRGDVEMTDGSYDWEPRNIATNFQLSLIADMFTFVAGDVFQMQKMGAASTGSTVGLPGRWLVDSITRDKSSLVSQFALVQPTLPKKEPAPTVKTVTLTGSNVKDVSKLPPGSADRAVAAAEALSNMKVPYVWGGGHSAGALNLTSASAIKNSIKGLDCSGSVCWVLHQAGMFPGTAAAVSGDLESWGDPGQGKSMTVWCNAGHTFIEFHLSGQSAMQLNTSYSGAGADGTSASGPRYLPWGDRGKLDADGGSFTARHWPGV